MVVLTGPGHQGDGLSGQVDDVQVPGGARTSTGAGRLGRGIFTDGKDASAFRTIGEVTRALDIAPHVLRYWEEQFPMLRPVKRSGGRRHYRPEDIALLEEIHALVHAQGYTLRGARQFLESRDKAGEPETLLDGLIALRADLAALLGD